MSSWELYNLLHIIPSVPTGLLWQLPYQQNLMSVVVLGPQWSLVAAICFWFRADKSRGSHKSLLIKVAELVKTCKPLLLLLLIFITSCVIGIPLSFTLASFTHPGGDVCWPGGVTFTVCSDSCTFALWIIEIFYYCLRQSVRWLSCETVSRVMPECLYRRKDAGAFQIKILYSLHFLFHSWLRTMLNIQSVKVYLLLLLVMNRFVKIVYFV